jgi:hypothetical protein
MSQKFLTLAMIFPSWKHICDKYDEICKSLPKQYPTRKQRLDKEESIHWEQTAFESILMLLIRFKIPFTTSASEVQKNIKTSDGKDKEIDFSINILGQEIYFGATSFRDSRKDLNKDTISTNHSIHDIRYSNGRFTKSAQVTSIRPYDAYLNRRLAVRVAREGKHVLQSDYIYVVFPTKDFGFGGGLDVLGKDFSFDNTDYHYKTNSITGLILIGELINVQSNKEYIERDVWVVKTKAFPHASDTVKMLLRQLDNATIDHRIDHQIIRDMLKKSNLHKTPNTT